MKAINIAATLITSCIPSDAPRAAASITFASSRSVESSTLLSTFSVSGMISFAINKLDGAAIIAAANKCSNGIPIAA
ncbi:Uncharacterised protein [Streptococcus pneumoniae]|nr:Uncharacterised protein [Streptococcus pneumoniae]